MSALIDLVARKPDPSVLSCAAERSVAGGDGGRCRLGVALALRQFFVRLLDGRQQSLEGHEIKVCGGGGQRFLDAMVAAMTIGLTPRIAFARSVAAVSLTCCALTSSVAQRARQRASHASAHAHRQTMRVAALRCRQPHRQAVAIQA
jgi:hypothetical protein